MHCIRRDNSTFLSYPSPLFQNESSCKDFHINMSLCCLKIDVSVKNIFMWIFLHEDSFGHRSKRKLRNGLLRETDFSPWQRVHPSCSGRGSGLYSLLESLTDQSCLTPTPVSLQNECRMMSGWF